MQLFVNNLTVIDCSYLHPEYGLTGESWIVDIVLSGALDAQGMIMDFGPLKKSIKQAIDASVDHALLVPANSSALSWDGEHTLHYRFSQEHQLTHSSPSDALCMIDTEVITPETVSAFLEGHLTQVVASGVEHIQVHLRCEEMGKNAYYHYSHGLKKHYGNCQRIAHGHRSRIEILRDGQRDARSEALWAEWFAHIYIGTREDIVEHTDDSITFAYEAGQGRYMLCLPAICVYLIDTDSTVEYIAQHIAIALKRQDSNGVYTVKAYEGVGKGAMVTL